MGTVKLNPTQRATLTEIPTTMATLTDYPPVFPE